MAQLLQSLHSCYNHGTAATIITQLLQSLHSCYNHGTAATIMAQLLQSLHSCYNHYTASSTTTSLTNAHLELWWRYTDKSFNHSLLSCILTSIYFCMLYDMDHHVCYELIVTMKYPILMAMGKLWILATNSIVMFWTIVCLFTNKPRVVYILWHFSQLYIALLCVFYGQQQSR